MEYKKCEHCGEQIHIRSKKCPFCNEIVEENPVNPIEEPKIEENSERQTKNENREEKQEKNEEKIEQQREVFDNPDKINPAFNFIVGGEDEPKDYVYKAEVRHTLEYVEPMSNWSKVFLAALCTFPLLGQFLGAFLGVYYITNDDADKKSFGKALVSLSIVMFVIYGLYVINIMALMEGMNLEELYNSLINE